MKIKNRKKLTKTKLLGLSVIGLLIVGGVVYITWQAGQSNQQSADTAAENISTIQEDRTYNATTENEEITVPDNVDPSSIKNYTLITENETYKIRELDSEYYITLYAIINHPNQSDMYQDQLRMYKQDALNYLNSQGIDTANKTIHYEPAEAANL